MLNGYEIILILTLALIFFGAKKLPELARGLGQGIREFKKASREVTHEFENMVEAETCPPKRTPPSSIESQPAIKNEPPRGPHEETAQHHA